MSTEMSDRVVNARVRVWSGSDDHAKHIVYWALSGNGVLFSDDQIIGLEKVLMAIISGEEIGVELYDIAAGLWKYGFTDSRAGEVLEMGIEKKGGVYVQA